MATETSTQAPTHVYRERDSYGRSVTVAERSCRRVGVLVAIPKRTAHLCEAPFFVNDYAKAGDEAVTWHATRALALAHLKSL